MTNISITHHKSAKELAKIIIKALELVEEIRD